jgi:putative transposase
MPATIRMRFGDRDAIRIAGVLYRYVRETDAGTGHILERQDASGACVPYDHDTLWRERFEPGFLYLPDHFDEDAVDRRDAAGVDAFPDIPDREKPLMVRKLSLCEGLRDLLTEKELRRAAIGRRKRDPNDPEDAVLWVSLSDAGLNRALDIIERREKKRTEGMRAPPGMRDVAKPSRPGVKALLGWYNALVEADWNPIVLRLDYHKCGHPGLRIPVESEAFMAKFAMDYASRERPTKKQCYADLVSAIREHNGTLGPGSTAVHVPCYDTFSRRIGQMGKFFLCLARFGEKRAKSKFKPNSTGVGALYPGQRVEVDSWMIQLHVLLIWGGMWDDLTEEQRREAESARVWVCVALDCATRVILGMALSATACSEAALAVVRMMVSDKSAYAEAVGAKSAWNMAVRPKTLVTDAGSEFLAERVRTTIAALRIDNVTTIAGEPWMRGTIERLFRTIHVSLVARFPGRTFENPVARGDYPSKARASLTLDQLSWALVRWVVDVYHNTPHEGLGGQTPANAWMEATRRFGISLPPGTDELRNSFGIDLTRTMGPSGVRVMGLHYQGEALQQHRQDYGDAEVELRYDAGDIGCVSVRLGDGWHPVRCRTPGFEGVSMDDWRLAATALRKRHGAEAALTQPVVDQALREIRALAKRTLESAGLGSEPPSRASVDAVERKLMIAFRLPERDETGPRPDLLVGVPPLAGFPPEEDRPPREDGSDADDDEPVVPDPSDEVRPPDDDAPTPAAASAPRRTSAPTPTRRRLTLNLKD